MATAVIRQGAFIDQYKIDDPGNASGFDNNLVIFSHRVDEIVRQVSSVNFRTFKENLLCWGDGGPDACPCDDDGEGGQLSGGLCFLNDIMLAGGVSVGADLTDLQEKKIYLAFWHEYRTETQMENMIAQMELEGLNATQQRRGLKFAYLSHGIDIDTAQAIANNRISNGVKATYDDYNLATIPVHDRRLLKLFGEVGWFV
jgi:hypothetical protein